MTPADCPKAECHDCGLPYESPAWADFVVPDVVWRQISPSGDENGLLCANCMVRRATERGIESEGRFTSGPFAASQREQYALVVPDLDRLRKESAAALGAAVYRAQAEVSGGKSALTAGLSAEAVERLRAVDAGHEADGRSLSGGEGGGMRTLGQNRLHLLTAAALLATWGQIAPHVYAPVVGFINALPDDMPCPQIGPDGEGDAMVVWGRALLVTIEEDWLHMVTRPTTPEARYFEDIPFDGTTLPAEVAAAVAEMIAQSQAALPG